MSRRVEPSITVLTMESSGQTASQLPFALLLIQL